jgi:hypothetical protein
MSRCLAAFALLAAQAHAGDLDQARMAWRYRRDVSVTASSGFAALELPPELRTHARADLRDVRLLAADGTEVPYVVDRVVDREASRTWIGTLRDTSREPVGPPEAGAARSVWTVDLDATRQVDTLALDVREQDFAKRVRVEGSTDAREWTTLVEDAPVFDRAWQGRVRHTRIALGTAASVRYLRLTTRDDRTSPPVTLAGVSASWTRRSPGERWERPASASFLSRANGVTRYRVDVPAGLALDEIGVATEDAAFSRRVELRETRGADERVLADGWVYRVRLPEEALTGERLTLPLSSPTEGGHLVLAVQDGDSPPLRGLRLTVSGAGTRLLFSASAAPVVLYYGNEVTRGALYDLAPLQDRIATSQALAAATLGPEQENRAYQKPAPLPLGLLRGAAVDVARWRVERPLPLASGEDLYVVTLAAEDLARARPDLGDVRLVDEAGRQVPYILEAAAKETRVPLQVEHTRRAKRVSRYRLRVPSLPAGGRVPVSSIALQVEETFFDRPLRVRASGGERNPRELWSGRIERRPAADPQATPEPIRLQWDAVAVRDLEVEIDDGDNEPLTLAGAAAFVRVPRVTFQAGAGAYRLLLGNPDATAPRYDLASLRREVLAYSAVGVELGPSRANPAFRRYAGDLLKDAPPTLLLWGTLLATVAALGWLTLRVIRQPPS